MAQTPLHIGMVPNPDYFEEVIDVGAEYADMQGDDGPPPPPRLPLASPLAIVSAVAPASAAAARRAGGGGAPGGGQRGRPADDKDTIVLQLHRTPQQ